MFTQYRTFSSEVSTLKFVIPPTSVYHTRQNDLFCKRQFSTPPFDIQIFSGQYLSSGHRSEMCGGFQTTRVKYITSEISDSTFTLCFPDGSWGGWTKARFRTVPIQISVKRTICEMLKLVMGLH